MKTSQKLFNRSKSSWRAEGSFLDSHMYWPVIIKKSTPTLTDSPLYLSTLVKVHHTALFKVLFSRSKWLFGYTNQIPRLIAWQHIVYFVLKITFISLTLTFLIEDTMAYFTVITKKCGITNNTMLEWKALQIVPMARLHLKRFVDKNDQV